MEKLREGFSTKFDTPSKRKPIPKDKKENETSMNLDQSAITTSTTHQFRTPKASPKNSPSSVYSLRSSISGSSVPFSPERLEELKPKPLRKIATNFFGIFFVFLILGILYSGIHNFRTQVSYPMLPYCDSEDFFGQTACITCPKFGYCKDGRLLLCEEPHLLEGGICIKNDDSEKLNAKVANYLSGYFTAKGGDYECGKTDKKSQPISTVGHIVSDRYGVNVNFTEVIQFIKEKPEFGLVIENDEMYSNSTKKSIVCMVKEAYQQNAKSILVCFTIMLVLGYLITKVE